MRSLDDRLAVLFGVWTACTVAPPLPYLLEGPFAGSLTLAAGALPVGLFMVSAGGGKLAVGRIADPAERFRDGIELGGPMLLASVVMFLSLPVGLIHNITAAGPFGVGGVVGFFTAFLVGYAADQTVIARARIATDYHLRWSATTRPDAIWVRVMRVVGAVAALVVAALVGTAGGQLLAAFWALMGVLQFGLLVQSGRRRQYELIDAGLVTAFGHLPWSQFDGYELSDDALLLYGNAWPFGTIAYDRDSIQDLKAVEIRRRSTPCGSYSPPESITRVGQLHLFGIRWRQRRTDCRGDLIDCVWPLGTGTLRLQFEFSVVSLGIVHSESRAHGTWYHVRPNSA